jgi:hypothetical protein
LMKDGIGSLATPIHPEGNAPGKPETVITVTRQWVGEESKDRRHLNVEKKAFEPLEYVSSHLRCFVDLSTNVSRCPEHDSRFLPVWRGVHGGVTCKCD